MLGFIVRDEDTEITLKFKRNISHQGPGETSIDSLSVVAAMTLSLVLFMQKERTSVERNFFA